MVTTRGGIMNQEPTSGFSKSFCGLSNLAPTNNNYGILGCPKGCEIFSFHCCFVLSRRLGHEEPEDEAGS